MSYSAALARSGARPVSRSATAAVIKEARRRQRRRRMRAAGIILLVGGVLTAGLGLFGANGHRSSSSSSRQVGRSASLHSVTVVYLKDETSPGRIESILAAMRGWHGVAGVTFISKSAALEVEKRHVPGLHLEGSNPLPAAIVVRSTAGSTGRIRADLETTGLIRAVARIRTSHS